MYGGKLVHIRSVHVGLEKLQKITKLWCSGFRTGNVKGARWMPWLVTAMKDVTNLRNASGRRYVAFDPEVSEWGNPGLYDLSFLLKKGGEPREVKHLST